MMSIPTLGIINSFLTKHLIKYILGRFIEVGQPFRGINIRVQMDFLFEGVVFIKYVGLGYGA
ncbi:hypothetical protein GCM10027340_04470 [Marinomonas epiphytica]